MRWLLLKDLQILRRSPLLTALLVLYPIVIAVLVGLALSAGPQAPRVAVVNDVPPDATLRLGGEELDVLGAESELCQRLDCVFVEDRETARELVGSGEVLGALVIPEDLLDQLRSLGGLTPQQPVVEVLVNEEDPLKREFVDDRIDAALAEANLELARRVSTISVSYLDILLAGGSFDFFGQSLEILGLEDSERILRSIEATLPPGSAERVALERVTAFSETAIENLGVADALLGAVSEPIVVDKEVVKGSAPRLDVFAIAVAATLTLMFVTVLLVAGSLALEREENAFARITRGLVSKTGLLAEKITLGVVVSLVVTVVMLAGLSLFVVLDWARFGAWIPAIVAGGAAFAAFGAAIGGAAREVRASSLLAFMTALPIAFISLVPSGTVSPGLFTVIEVIAFVFPFDAALQALEGALDSTGPSLWPAIAHLAGLTLAWGAVARFALRRFE
ncbi:MAG: ABC transporter permease [Solirubrobacterales bacterium]